MSEADIEAGKAGKILQEGTGRGEESPAKAPVYARIMLVGESHCGKSSIIRALTHEEYRPRKALAPVYFRNFVDTPGEFLENRRFFRALITASAHCDALVFVQDATRSWCMLHPGLARMFNRKVVGVITKCDHERANVERARRFLANTGVRDIVEARLHEPRGPEELRAALAGHGIVAG